MNEAQDAPERICADKTRCRWEWVVCAGRGSAFNIYRCALCGREDWL